MRAAQNSSQDRAAWRQQRRFSCSSIGRRIGVAQSSENSTTSLSNSTLLRRRHSVCAERLPTDIILESLRQGACERIKLRQRLLDYQSSVPNRSPDICEVRSKKLAKNENTSKSEKSNQEWSEIRQAAEARFYGNGNKSQDSILTAPSSDTMDSTGNSTNSKNNDSSLMADYISLKLAMAELQSQLQVAQTQVQNASTSATATDAATVATSVANCTCSITIKQLQQENETCQKENETLQEENETCQKRNTKQKEYDLFFRHQLRQDIEQLQQEKYQLQQENQQLERDKENLQQEKDVLSQRNAELEEDNLFFRKLLSSLERLGKLRGTYADYLWKDKIGRLEKTSTAHVDRLDSKEDVPARTSSYASLKNSSETESTSLRSSVGTNASDELTLESKESLPKPKRRPSWWGSRMSSSCNDDSIDELPNASRHTVDIIIAEIPRDDTEDTTRNINKNDDLSIKSSPRVVENEKTPTGERMKRCPSHLSFFEGGKIKSTTKSSAVLEDW
eukprot:CAMPEP_0183719838 /NCGR_PEP_ID=MMETSP0737-20130205/12617_1 /TAXON_ID=385413 /ORGANISM="Thalassiosira miniscula, Strain CCMP1093" /LENGTH=505 /DNA_ID=CAMNT_0025949597 /DNA_START=62 /DNA_END=1576 /DNA_ORIENTATION=-